MKSSMTLTRRALDAISSYCEANQLNFDEEKVGIIFEDDASSRVQQGMYTLHNTNDTDPSRIFFIVQRNDLTPSQTDLTVFVEANRIINNNK